MAWFLTKKKKSAGRSTKKPSPTASQRRQQVLTAGAVIALAALIVAGWYVGEKRLRQYIETTRQTQTAPDSVVLLDRPAWMNDDIAKQVQARASEALSHNPNPLDGASLQEAAKVLGMLSWVKQVKQVERLGDGRVAVAAAYREPVAVIEDNNGYAHLVDREGVVLAGLGKLASRAELKAQTPLPLIVGVNVPPPHFAGQQWSSDAVAAGLALAQLLADEPFAKQILACDASLHDASGRVRLALLTQSGQVDWGYPPGREMGIEPPAQEKLQRLRDLATRHGRIDLGGQRVFI